MDISMSNDSGASNTTRAATSGRFTFRQKPLTGIQCNFAERQFFFVNCFRREQYPSYWEGYPKIAFQGK